MVNILVHYCDFADIYNCRLYCSQEWAVPEWGCAELELVPTGVFITTYGNYYSFGLSNVNCSDCLDKKNLEDALE